jgi:hypothetical protein
MHAEMKTMFHFEYLKSKKQGQGEANLTCEQRGPEVVLSSLSHLGMVFTFSLQI